MEVVCKIWRFQVENWRPAPLLKNPKKIVENRRFSENGWPKSKSNTGNGFLGVDYICLDTSHGKIENFSEIVRGGQPPPLRRADHPLTILEKFSILSCEVSKHM